MRGIWVIRCVMVALGAAIAVALIVHGNVVIGGLLAALVATRAVLFVTMMRRRREIRRRFRQRFANRL